LKSLLLADLCICVADGLPWLEPLPGNAGKAHTTQQAPVIWLDFDNGQNRTDQRFEALARARNVAPDRALSYYCLPSPWFDAGDPKSCDALIKRIERDCAQFVVIDNLGIVHPGIDENSPLMSSVMANLRRIAEGTGCALVLLHHPRKMNMFNGRAG